MATQKKSSDVLNAKEFSEMDFKTGALTFSKDHRRCTVPLVTKPFVQLQGLAEPIHTFDQTGRTSNTISFFVKPDDDFAVFGTKLKTMGTEIYTDRVWENATRIFSELYIDEAAKFTVLEKGSHAEYKDFIKERDGHFKVTLFLHPTFTKYWVYDRDTKKKTLTSLAGMKSKPLAFYSVILKVDHLDITWDERESKMVCGMVSYVHSLCYIVPREADKKNLKSVAELVRREPDFDLAAFDMLGGGEKEEEKSKKRKLVE